VTVRINRTGTRARKWGDDMVLPALPRRGFLHLAASLAAFPVMARAARAEVYPSRPVHLVVGFGPGGSPEIIARLVGQSLSERLGQQFVIENRPGAGTTIATEAVVRSSPDGYTLLLVTLPNLTSGMLYERLPFDFMVDIVPIASINLLPQVMVVNQNFPAKTVPEFIANAKANPGKVNMASTGSGNLSHLSIELFKIMADVNIVHVPYRGAGPAQTDLLSGRVDGMFDTIPALIEPVRGGRLRGLAVTTKKRLAALPDLPTVGDSVPGFEVNGLIGVGAPKGTPTEIIGKLNRDINAAVADPKLRARLADLGAVTFTGSPADFSRFLAQESDKWGKVIRSANIRAD
jgi:tripartite-type tricarboxylate transporter receptor subunit TctC